MVKYRGAGVEISELNQIGPPPTKFPHSVRNIPCVSGYKILPRSNMFLQQKDMLRTLLLSSLLAFVASQTACVDTDEQMCQMEKKITKQTDTPWSYRCETEEWISETCPSTCNLCPGSVVDDPTMCADRDEEWCAKKLECTTDYEFYNTECRWNDVFVKTCKKTCNLCPEDPNCYDLDRYLCQEQKQAYDTSKMSWVYGCETDSMLIDNCKKSCGVCDQGTPSGDVCKDRDEEWCKKKAQCEDAFVFFTTDCKFDPIAMAMCQQTCGICSTGAEICEDKVPDHCEKQKSMYGYGMGSWIYECQNNANGDADVCQKSCKLCPEDNMNTGECIDRDEQFCVPRKKLDVEAMISFVGSTCPTDPMVSEMCQASCKICSDDAGICSDKDEEFCAARKKMDTETGISFVGMTCPYETVVMDVCQASCRLCPEDEANNGECLDKDPEFCAARQKMDVEVMVSFVTSTCVHDTVISDVCQQSCKI